MAESLNVDKPLVLDLLDKQGGPALSATSDMPVIETKPDAQNEGAPPAAPSEAEKPTEEAKQPEESATSATDEQFGEPAKPKESRGVQKALDRLTAEREEQKRRAETLERQLGESLEILKRLTGGNEQQRNEPPVNEDPEPLRPSRTEYTDPETWEQAMLDYSDRKAAWSARTEVARTLAKEREQMQQQAAVQAEEQRRQVHQQRIEKFKTTTPDFDAYAASADVQVSIPMAAAIFDSENGPALQYWLGKNPDEAKRIFNLPYTRQLLELGKIEADLTRPAPANASQPKPKPINPITLSSDQEVPSGDNESMESYAARRRKAEGWADPTKPKIGLRH